MNYIKYPANFGELTDDLSNYDGSKAVILPVPYEKTTTYKKGTSKGPLAVIDASRNMELYDEELDADICKVGICTLKELSVDQKPELMVDVVSENVKRLIVDKKFPVVIGGEHSITPGCVKAFAERYKNFCVLHLDAHADLREDYDGTKFSHACAIKRCLDICKNIIQVGIRSLSYEESVFAKENHQKIYWAKDIFDNDKWMQSAVKDLDENVYITLDIDVFDPSVVPSTGTPEPGGLLYYHVLKFLRMVFEKKNVVGFDVVELCPNEIDVSSDFIASKVIYKMIGYKFMKQLAN